MVFEAGAEQHLRHGQAYQLGVGESLRSAGAAPFGFDHVVVDQLTRRTCNHGGSARRRVPATSTRSAQPVHTGHGV